MNNKYDIQSFLMTLYKTHLYIKEMIKQLNLEYFSQVFFFISKYKSKTHRSSNKKRLQAPPICSFFYCLYLIRFEKKYIKYEPSEIDMF